MCKRIEKKQASKRGIYNGEDIKITKEEQLQILRNELSKDVQIKDGFFVYGDIKIIVKNITFLGWKANSDRSYKKRIQLGKSKALTEYIKDRTNKILLGIYKNKFNEITFVVWERFKDEIGKSSSNHVNVNDLMEANYADEIFIKYDRFGNKISVIPQNKLFKFFITSEDPVRELARYIFNGRYKWKAEDCIVEMYNNGFSSAKQTEWPGFYFEYITEKLFKNRDDFIIPSGKKYGNWVPDAFSKFPIDLKYHSIGKKEIPGNDYEGVIKAIAKYGKIGILLAEGVSTKSKTSDNWRRDFFDLPKSSSQNPRILKGTATIKSISYFDVNIKDIESRGLFKQGKNSNGNPRKPKTFYNTDQITKKFSKDKY